ncbi:MAG TPA: hypothetical protein VGF89_03930 [Steroidobacteraceae bacterium]|jgi:hypothetical protein
MSDTKACPYCGEQILAVAVKCKHCGSALDGAAPAGVKNPHSILPGLRTLGIIVLALVAAGLLYTWYRNGVLPGQGFTDADITRVENDIRTQFATREGWKIEEVQMMRESPRKLTGFAKVKVPILGSINKSCTATYGDSSKGSQYIWECK